MIISKEVNELHLFNIWIYRFINSNNNDVSASVFNIEDTKDGRHIYKNNKYELKCSVIFLTIFSIL